MAKKNAAKANQSRNLESEKRIATAAPFVLQLIGWSSILGLLVAVVGGIAGVDSSYRIGSFIFSAGLFIVYAIATPARPEDENEQAVPHESGGNGKK